MSNKKRIAKKQKSFKSIQYSNKMWEAIFMAYKAINNAIDLRREVLTKLNENKFPPGGFIPSDGKREVIVGKNYEERVQQSWETKMNAVPKKIEINFDFPEPLKQLEAMLALERTRTGEIKTVFAGSRDYVAKQNTK